MRKKILVVLAAIILIFVVVVALQPSDFRVERSATMAASPADVFAQVNDLHKWDAWSPWAKLDPNAKITFEGPEAGQGAVLSWAGNEKLGEGKMTIVEARPDEAVKFKVDFVKPFEGTSNSEFVFEPEGDKTAVTWTMTAHHNFFEKALCLLMNGKKMIGAELEKGLAQMKAIVEQPRSASN